MGATSDGCSARSSTRLPAGSRATHALITIDAVRRMAAGRVGDDWDARFDAMLDYARTKGWIDDTDNAIQAHVEYDTE